MRRPKTRKERKRTRSLVCGELIAEDSSDPIAPSKVRDQDANHFDLEQLQLALLPMVP